MVGSDREDRLVLREARVVELPGLAIVFGTIDLEVYLAPKGIHSVWSEILSVN